MRDQSDVNVWTPVGVVPRRQVQSIQTLMSDAPETCSVAEGIESPGDKKLTPLLPQWLSAATTFGIIAAALEWLKLTR